MSDTTTLTRGAPASTPRTSTWVAFGAAGAIASIRRDAGGFTVRMLRTGAVRSGYPTLEVAKSALVALLPSGAERPEFREH